MSGFSRTDETSQTDEDLRLLEIADLLRSTQPQPVRVAAARDPELRRLMDARPDRSASTTATARRVVVDPERARFSAWYEMFPRSCTSDPRRSGTFREAEARLPAIADMGFDVVYLPPVHPIGTTHRKGRNNALTATPGDPGSPWAIGSEAGGHTAVDPGLGTLDDFDRFVAAARHLGMAGGAGHRLPGVARSSVGPRAPRMVPASARRVDQVRGESAEEVPGHLPLRLREPRVRGALGGAPRRLPVLDVARRRRSSASTTRTRNRSRSGSGRSPTSGSSTRTRSSWRKRSRARR